jgi:hypothetical protein
VSTSSEFRSLLARVAVITIKCLTHRFSSPCNRSQRQPTSRLYVATMMEAHWRVDIDLRITLSVAALLTACYSNDGTSSLARECLIFNHMLSSVIHPGSCYIDYGTSLPGCECFVSDLALSMVTTSRIRYSDECMSSLVCGSSAPESMFSEVTSS